ncbi:MAG TPA: hypothetical protein VFP36_00795 [Usitatibacter sp.]|nr:hypothetical protein [Usitatibacter sp.]
MATFRIRRMVRELRADPSTQFFEPLLCGAALSVPRQDFAERLRGEALAAHPWAAALSIGTHAFEAAAPAPATVELRVKEDFPLPR